MLFSIYSAYSTCFTSIKRLLLFFIILFYILLLFIVNAVDLISFLFGVCYYLHIFIGCVIGNSLEWPLKIFFLFPYPLLGPTDWLLFFVSVHIYTVLCICRLVVICYMKCLTEVDLPTDNYSVNLPQMSTACGQSFLL